MEAQRLKAKILYRNDRDDGKSECRIEVCGRSAKKRNKFSVFFKKSDRTDSGQQTEPVCDDDKEKKGSDQRKKLLYPVSDNACEKIIQTADNQFPD